MQSRDPVQDGAHDADRQMDFEEVHDFADQGPLTDIDMEEDAQILATLLKHLPSCINAADMEHPGLLQQSPDNSTQLQEQSAPWRCLCRYTARQGQQ